MTGKKTLVDNEIVDQAEVEGSQEGEQTEFHSQAQAPKSSKAIVQPFDPTQYLSNFDGRDYLEVKWRLLWLRSQHPDARITPQILQHKEEGGFALFPARGG